MAGDAVPNGDASGWRDIYWIQGAFHISMALGLLLCHWPPHPVRLSRVDSESLNLG